MRGELRVALGKADRDGAALGVERRRSEGLSQRRAEAQAALAVPAGLPVV